MNGRNLSVFAVLIAVTVFSGFSASGESGYSDGGSTGSSSGTIPGNASLYELSYSVDSGTAEFWPNAWTKQTGSTKTNFRARGDVYSAGSDAFYYRPESAGGAVQGAYSRSDSGNGNNDGVIYLSKGMVDIHISLPIGGGIDISVPDETWTWFSNGDDKTGTFEPLTTPDTFVLLKAKIVGHDWLGGDRTSSNYRMVHAIPDSAGPTVSTSGSSFNWLGANISTTYTATDALSGLKSKRLFYASGYDRDEAGRLIWDDITTTTNVTATQIVFEKAGVYKLIAFDNVGNPSRKLLTVGDTFRFPDDYSSSGAENILGHDQVKDVTDPILSIKVGTTNLVPTLNAATGKFVVELPVAVSTAFTVTAAEAYAGDSGVDLQEFDYDQNQTANQSAAGLSHTIVVSGAKGQYTWEFRVKDRAGNDSIPLVIKQRLLPDAPVISFPDLASTPWKPATVKVQLTDAMGWTVEAHPTAFPQFEYSKNGGAWTNLIPNGVATTAIGLDDGTTNLTFRAKDEAGTSAAVATSLTVNVDTGVPILGVKNKGVDVKWDESTNHPINYSDGTALSVQLSDATSGLNSLVVTWPNNSVPVYTKGTTIEKSATKSFTPRDGDSTYRFTLTDVSKLETVKDLRLITDSTPIATGSVALLLTDVNSGTTYETFEKARNYSNLKVIIRDQASNYAKPASVNWTVNSVTKAETPSLVGADYVAILQSDLTSFPENTEIPVSVTVVDQVGHQTTAAFVFKIDRSPPTPVKGWIPRDSIDTTSFLVQPTDEDIVIYQVTGTSETRLWDSGAVLVNGSAVRGTLAFDPVTGVGSIVLKAVDRVGNSVTTLPYKVVRPVAPSAPVLQKVVASTSDSFTVNATSADPSLSWGGKTYVLSYKGVGIDGSGNSLGTTQSAVGKIWSQSALTSAGAFAPGALGTFKAWVELTAPTTTDSQLILLDQSSAVRSFAIPNSAPVFTAAGTWPEFFGTAANPFTTEPLGVDPDGHPIRYRYVVTSGTGPDLKSWTSEDSVGILPALDRSKMAVAGLTDPWLSANGLSLSLEAWAGQSATPWASQRTTLGPRVYLAGKVDLVPPAVGAVGAPWASSPDWTSSSTFSLALTDIGSGLVSVLATAAPLTANGLIDSSRPTLDLSVSGTVSGASAVVQGTLPSLEGLYQLSVTVADKARNIGVSQGLKAQFDYSKPSLTSVAIRQTFEGTGSSKVYFADALGAVKAALTGTDVGGGIQSWEYQVSGGPWIYGGSWLGGTSLEVTAQPGWTTELQRIRWRVIDRAGNASQVTEADWVSVSYVPDSPAFALNVSGLVGSGSQRYAKAMADLSVSLTPSQAAQWRAIRTAEDGTETVSSSQPSWAALRGLANWWVDGGRYRVAVTVTSDNLVSGTQESEAFVLDSSAPSAVELSVVAPANDRTEYFRNEAFLVEWAGGVDAHGPVARTIRLYRLLDSVATTVSTVDLSTGQTQASVHWGTGDWDLSVGSYWVSGTATNGAGYTVTSPPVSVPLRLQGPWMTVSVNRQNSGIGDLAASWSSGNIPEADHYLYELWKRGTVDALLLSSETKTESQVFDLSPLSLSDGDELEVRVRAYDGLGALLVSGSSPVSRVDAGLPVVQWRTGSGAVTSSRVGGWYDVVPSASGLASVSWRIEKKAQGSSDWTVLPDSGGDWRTAAPALSGSVESDLTGQLETGVLVRLTVRVENGVGRVAQDTRNLLVDDTAPPRPLVLDQGIAVNHTRQPLVFNWSLSEEDPDSAIRSYEYGWLYRGEASVPTQWTALSEEDLRDRRFTAEFDLSTEAVPDGKVVVLAVKAVNGAGLVSIGYSDGIILDHTAPLIYSVAVFGDAAKTRPLSGYVPGTAISANRVYVSVGARDEESGWSRRTVQAKLWNDASKLWDEKGSVEAGEGEQTSITVAGGFAAGSLWRFETKVTDEAGNVSAVGVSDGFLVEGAVAAVKGLTMDVDAHDVLLNWSLDDQEKARWVQSYQVTAVWTDSHGTARQKTVVTSQRSASLAWGPEGLDLKTGSTVQFTVFAYSYTGTFRNSSETSDYRASLTVDTRPPQLLAETKSPPVPASQFYDSINGHLAYSGDRGVSSLQWSAVLVPGEVPLVGWNEKNWSTAWDFQKELSQVTSGSLASWNGKLIRLKYRAANSMGIWSEVTSTVPVRVDTTAPDVADLTRPSLYSKEIGAVTGWSLKLKDSESGILDYMTALVPAAQAGSYVWPSSSPVHAVPETAASVTTEASIDVPLVDNGVGTYVSLLRVRNATGHWFLFSGPSIEMDRTAPVVAPIDWTATSVQSWIDQGQTVRVNVTNGPSQAFVGQADEKATWTVSGSWMPGQTLPLSRSASGTLDLQTVEPGDLYAVTFVVEDQAGNQTTIHETLRYNRAPVISSVAGAFTLRPGVPVRIDSLVTINDDEGSRPGDYPLSFRWIPGNGTAIQTWTGGGGVGTVFGASEHATTFFQTPVKAQVSIFSGVLIVTDRYGKSSQTFNLPIRVENSHEGTLATDERWSGAAGAFELRGWVTVPAGRTLTLDQAEVNVAANLSGGYLEAGILVAPGGLLKVTNSSSPKTSTMKPLQVGTFWRGIRVGGEVSGAGLQVEGAERAITLLPGGRVDLAGSSLRGNRMALHLLGGTLLLEGSEITGNDEYGAKEDATGSYVFRGTSFGGNGVNYYRYQTTGISVDELNQLPGNSNNVGVE